jgi:small subunit ribosomal protein S6
LSGFSIRDKEPRGGRNLRRYETIFITLADLPSEEIENLINRYKDIITSMGGVVVFVNIWGKRRLAYEIRKNRDGIYVLVNFVGEHAVLAEFERNMKFDERILRAQSVKLIDKVDMAEIERELEEAREKAAAAAAKATAAEVAAASEPEVVVASEPEVAAASEPEVVVASEPGVAAASEPEVVAESEPDKITVAEADTAGDDVSNVEPPKETSEGAETEEEKGVKE